MLQAEARIADDTDVAAKLRLCFPRSRKNRRESFALASGHCVIEDGLVEPVEDLPILACVSQYANALAGESPVERVDAEGLEPRNIPRRIPCCLGHGLFGREIRKEGSWGIEYILQGTTPNKGYRRR